MSIKFPVLGGGFWVLGGGGKCRFYFYGREDFSEFLRSLKQLKKKKFCHERSGFESNGIDGFSASIPTSLSLQWTISLLQGTIGICDRKLLLPEQMPTCKNSGLNGRSMPSSSPPLQDSFQTDLCFLVLGLSGRIRHSHTESGTFGQNQPRPSYALKDGPAPKISLRGPPPTPSPLPRRSPGPPPQKE